MSKRPHKVLGIEMLASNTSVQTDPLTQAPRYGLTWGSLSGPQQALLIGKNRRRLGQTGVS